MCQSMIESLKTRADCQMHQVVMESVELLELIAEVERLRFLNEAMGHCKLGTHPAKHDDGSTVLVDQGKAWT